MLVLATSIVLLVSPCAWEPDPRQLALVAWSDNGRYVVEAQAADREGGTIELREAESGAVIWSGTPANPTAPLELYVDDTGRYAITRGDVDTPAGAHAVVIYDASNDTRVSFGAHDLVDDASLERRARWGRDADAWFSPAGHFLLRTHRHGDVVFDLVSGGLLRGEAARDAVAGSTAAIAEAKSAIAGVLAPTRFRRFVQFGRVCRATLEDYRDYSQEHISPGNRFEGLLAQSVAPDRIWFRKGTAGVALRLQAHDNAGGGFEDDLLWEIERWTGNGEFVRDATTVHEGEYSMRVSAGESMAGALVQRVRVQPQTDYVLRAWVKTQDVQLLSPGTSGATIAIREEKLTFMDGATGTRDWTLLERIFNTESLEEVHIMCVYGGLGPMRGTAWFDDVTLQPLR